MENFIVTLVFVAALVSGQPVQYNVNPTSDWKVVGGANAAEGQFPYQISLRAYGSHNCGGSILNEEWILTAAHCAVGYSEGSLSVVVGTTTLNEGGTTHNVSKIIYNKEYSPILIQNDVAVLKLSRPLEFNSNVQPIQLESENVESVDCVISGWGRTSFPGNIPNSLQFIELRTITVSECQDRWIFNPVVDSQICTLTKKGEGVCHGDSGGPLVANGKQIGIVSWGNPCANGIPDVYTRVSSFHSWVEDAIQN